MKQATQFSERLEGEQVVLGIAACHFVGSYGSGVPGWIGG
jgi:hypothetical protein